MGMNTLFRTLVFCFVLLFFSCSESQSTTDENVFNSEAFFSREASRLTFLSMPVLKIVTRNSEVDSSRNIRIDWKKELEPFKMCNINKPSLQHSYRVDSVTDEGKRHVMYTAIEPHLVVRTLDLDYEGNFLRAFQAVTAESNELYTTTRELRYVPDSGYRIRGRQAMRMGDKTDYVVSVSWK